MNKFLFGFLSASLLAFPAAVLAGGGLISTEVYPNNGSQNINVPVGEEFIVKPQVHLSNEDPYDATIKWCKNCPIKIKLENPQPDDVINQSADKTDDSGQIYAKVISHIQGVRYVYAEVTLPTGEVYTGSKTSLNYAPTVIYGSEPQASLAPVTTSPNTTKNTGQTVALPSANVTVNNDQSVGEITPNLASSSGSQSSMEQIPQVQTEATLEAKVDQLQQQLDESKQKQSALEKKLNDLINWIRYFFSFKPSNTHQNMVPS